MSFVHLHNHSHFTILQGLPRPGDYVKKAKELGMSAVALTDTANLHGCHEFYKTAKAEWIKPILGTEIYVKSSLDPTLNHRLVLLAKNLEGYQNIIALSTKASLENDAGKAHILFEDIEALKAEKKDLHIVCLSWPLSWEIPYYILSGKSDSEIHARIEKYQTLFWKQNYFLELLAHSDIPKQDVVTNKLIELHEQFGVPVVAANNCYYVEKSDKRTQDVIQALGTGHEIENPDRPTLLSGDYSFFSEEEMQQAFGYIPSALTNTQKIADMIDIEIETGWVLIPTFELPESDQAIFEDANSDLRDGIKKLESDEWYLRYISFKGLNWRYDYGIDEETILELVNKKDKPGLEKELTKTSPEELQDLSITYYSEKKKAILDKMDKDIADKIERLEYELVVVHEMGFNAYFLIVADYINWAREQNIPVWPGRWSAAGSLMAFLSGITDIDPLPYGLIFERFLNPARISMPDIDTDFSDDARDKVIEYCRNKYGADHVAQICTFGTFAARAAVKDVGRVYGISFAEMNGLAKLIPEKPGTKLADALEESLEFKEAYDMGYFMVWNKRVAQKDIIDNALKIEGNVRQIGVHACAVIIAPEPMTQFTALAHPPKDGEAIITQYSANPLEDLGLLKMDFLWLRNLTIIQRALRIIKNNKDVDIDILDIPLDNKDAYQVFADGDTTWVFQFESDGMRKYLKDLWPTEFEDLIAMVSLYRPGPLQYIPTFIDRKHGKEKVEYPHESLQEILQVTEWIAVYQEQIMKMVQVFAGFSLGEADILRRAIGKKKIEVLMTQKKIFIDAAKALGHPETLSKHIFEDVIEPFAGYWFNKSHAACYALIAYQTAYLKALYPAEFLTSLMVSDEENMERIVMEVAECEQKGISVLPPSINESLTHFTYIDDKNIRFGLLAIKGLWDGPIEKIIEARNSIDRDVKHFEDINEFITLCGKEVINKKSLESLIKAGAMDSLWERKAMFEAIPEMIKYMKSQEQKTASSQIGIFDMMDNYDESLKLPEVWSFSAEERLVWEQEMIGFFVSGHPLDGLSRYCLRRSQNTKKLKMSFDDLSQLPEYQPEEKPEIKDDEVIKDMKDEKPDDTKKEKKKPAPKKEQEMVSAVGLVTDIRKIITKKWTPMLFLKCDGYDYDFEAVIFPKDVEKYIDKVDINKVIIINGALNVNMEYKRKSIQTRELKIASITMVRDQAKDLWLMDSKKRFVNMALNEVVEEPKTINATKEPMLESSKQTDAEIEAKIEKNKTEKAPKIRDKYVVTIPKTAQKQDLQDLKEFLLMQTSGPTNIYIDLNGQEIFTKIAIQDLSVLEAWEQDKWNIQKTS